jgi:hypothetical protein
MPVFMPFEAGAASCAAAASAFRADLAPPEAPCAELAPATPSAKATASTDKLHRETRRTNSFRRLMFIHPPLSFPILSAQEPEFRGPHDLDF